MGGLFGGGITVRRIGRFGRSGRQLWLLAVRFVLGAGGRSWLVSRGIWAMTITTGGSTAARSTGRVIGGRSFGGCRRCRGRGDGGSDAAAGGVVAGGGVGFRAWSSGGGVGGGVRA